MSMKRITLCDLERDVVVEAYVTPAEARRAAKDTAYATELLKKITEHEPLPSTSTKADFENADTRNDDNGNDDTGNDDTHENFIYHTVFDTEDPGDPNSETQESEGNLYRWTPPCVWLLLETYKSMEKILNSGTMSQKKVWEKISLKLKTKGYNVSGPQCSSKLRSLKKTYKSIKNHNSKSGNDRRPWQFFNVMEEILAKKALCHPLAIASSTGLSSKQLKTSNNEGTDNGCSTQSNKITIANLLRKRLKQKEEHEEHKMKRHKERMEMDEKFLRVLEKFADK